jgi:hypothetical protein
MGGSISARNVVSQFAPTPISLWALAQELGMSKPVSIRNLVKQLEPVPAPAHGLGSNSNYFLDSNGNPLIGLSVTINVTQDIVFQSASGSTKGFTFQLNAFSPQNETCAFQKYALALLGDGLYGVVNNWTSTSTPICLQYDMVVPSYSVAPVPIPNLPIILPIFGIPAGWKLTIFLFNKDNVNVTGAMYMVHAYGQTVSVAQDLTSISGVTSADLAPIVSFELDIVGPGNGESAALSSGAGTIVYTAASPLVVSNQQPANVESPGEVTLEMANTSYGVLPTMGLNNTLSQSFAVIDQRLTIRKPGKARPPLRLPSAKV